MLKAVKQNQLVYAYGLGLVGVVCFAATLPLTTIALNDFSPTLITMLRAVIAASAALVWILMSHSSRPAQHEIKPLLVSGCGLIFGFPPSNGDWASNGSFLPRCYCFGVSATDDNCAFSSCP